MRLSICLLILPASDLAGLMRRQVRLLEKLGLLSLRVVKASRLAVALIRSSRSSFSVMFLVSDSILFVVFGVTLLYVLVMFFEVDHCKAFCPFYRS